MVNHSPATVAVPRIQDVRLRKVLSAELIENIEKKGSADVVVADGVE
jgi:hypothetical protein